MITQTKGRQVTEREMLVMSRTDEGFRVYSPTNPTLSYLVTGDEQSPQCSCGEFEDQQYQPGQPVSYCRHIAAVLAQFRQPPPYPSPADGEEREERLAIQDEGQLTSHLQAVPVSNGNPSQMLIKRSISPDGRIDSLSVEFRHSLEKDSVGAIKDKAIKTLWIQSDIVEAFLGNGKTKSGNQAPQQQSDSAIPATMLDIAGMPGKWGGRRLFINVQANGHRLKLFGSRQQLSEYVTAAGFWNMAQQVAEGVRLNLPCRITTKPSADGRFQNVDQVLPSQGSGHQRRAGP